MLVLVLGLGLVLVLVLVLVLGLVLGLVRGHCWRRRYAVKVTPIPVVKIPRRTDQCNLHTHVIANKNKSPR